MYLLYLLNTLIIVKDLLNSDPDLQIKTNIAAKDLLDVMEHDAPCA